MKTQSFKRYKDNKFFCTLEGIIASDFKNKDVNSRTVYQSKIYSTNSNFDKELLKHIKEIDDTINDNIKISNSILLNFWHVEVYEKYKDMLEKGSVIKAEGLIGYKVYNRFCGGKQLHLFFAVNDIVEVISVPEKNSTSNRLSSMPQVLYAQF